MTTAKFVGKDLCLDTDKVSVLVLKLGRLWARVCLGDHKYAVRVMEEARLQLTQRFYRVTEKDAALLLEDAIAGVPSPAVMDYEKNYQARLRRVRNCMVKNEIAIHDLIDAERDETGW